MTGAGHIAPDRAAGAYEVAALTGVVAIIAVEALLVAPGHLLAAQIADALLVLALVNVGPRRSASVPSARADAALGALRALALVPLIRVVALGLPMRDWIEPVAILAIALPVGGVALRLAPIVHMRLRRLFSPVFWLTDVYAVVVGGLLGLVAYLAGAPALYPDGADGGRVALGLAAGALAAAVEELVFRGLVQGTLQRVFGRVGMVAATAVFTATYLDAESTALVLTFVLAGIVFGHAAGATGAIVGAVVGHILLVIGAGAVWPEVLGDSGLPDLSEPGSTIGLSIVSALALGLACWQPLNPDPDNGPARGLSR